MFTFQTFWQFAKDLGADTKRCSIMRLRNVRTITEYNAKARPELNMQYDHSGLRTGHYIGVIAFNIGDSGLQTLEWMSRKGCYPMAAARSANRITLYWQIA